MIYNPYILIFHLNYDRDIMAKDKFEIKIMPW